MGLNEELIRINGLAYDWGDVTIKIEGRRFEGITGLSYSDKLEPVAVTGNTRDRAPLGTTSGKYTCEDGRIMCGTREVAEDIYQYIATLGGGVSFGATRFLITVSINAPGKASITDSLLRCRIIGRSAAHEDSSDPLKTEIPIKPQSLLWNGLTLHQTRFGI